VLENLGNLHAARDIDDFTMSWQNAV